MRSTEPKMARWMMIGRANACSASESALLVLFFSFNCCFHRLEQVDREIRFVVEVESLGQLEVELDGGTLVLSAKRVFDLDVDLRAVEGAVALFKLPGEAKLVQTLLQLRFRAVPGLDLAEEVLWAGRQLQVELEAEHTVDALHEVQASVDLTIDLMSSR